MSILTWLFICAGLASDGTPPATRPSGFEQALAGLQSMHAENQELRARVAALEQERQMTVRIRAGEAVHVRADEFGLLGDERKEPSPQRGFRLAELLFARRHRHLNVHLRVKSTVSVTRC